MGKYSKLRERILAGSADSNIEFAELRTLLGRLEFVERVRGDHHIFTRNGVAEIINLQPKGKKAKPYQVKQVRGILVKYQLGESDVD
ncbi:MAG: type II toxin-antitoxin system HicA family toxin [Gammaproteobacteria bacterium]